MPIVVTLTLTCPSCASEALVKYGFTSDGRQRYRCKTCAKQHREKTRTHTYTEAQKDTILCATQERSSLRGVSRTFKVSRQTLTGWIKKKQANSPS